jgi:hypothetical protein
MSENGDTQCSDEESQENWDDWEDDERVPVKSLFTKEIFKSVDEALHFDARCNGFDLLQWREKVIITN